MVRFSPAYYFREFYLRIFSRIVFDDKKNSYIEDIKILSIGDKDKALKKLNNILINDIGRDFDFKKDSIHWFLWSVISLNYLPKRILEIGTGEGVGTKILAQLFPKSSIITVDLPESDPLLRSFYKRETDEDYKAYLEKQSKNLESSNIKALKINSFFLPANVQGQFDLIWVDGGHLFPEVSWDICNAWNLCSPGGIILFDDVIPSNKEYKTKYISTESNTILNYIRVRTDISPILFLKRRDPRLYASILTRKYVAYIKKP